MYSLRVRGMVCVIIFTFDERLFGGECSHPLGITYIRVDVISRLFSRRDIKSYKVCSKYTRRFLQVVSFILGYSLSLHVHFCFPWLSSSPSMSIYGNRKGTCMLGQKKIPYLAKEPLKKGRDIPYLYLTHGIL